MTLKKLNSDLSKLEKKLLSLQDKKNTIVSLQFFLEDNDLTDSYKYRNAIDKDFEIAFKIIDVQRLIKNKKNQIRRFFNKIKIL